GGLHGSTYRGDGALLPRALPQGARGARRAVVRAGGGRDHRGPAPRSRPRRPGGGLRRARRHGHAGDRGRRRDRAPRPRDARARRPRRQAADPGRRPDAPAGHRRRAGAGLRRSGVLRDRRPGPAGL
ncbi:MAG: hypothetical protein AVDCRST_MAG30-1672, partial [uncultured Solirubrobacteraceae bacterium]